MVQDDKIHANKEEEKLGPQPQALALPNVVLGELSVMKEVNDGLNLLY